MCACCSHGGSLLREAVAAVDGTVAARLERELGLLAALGADRREELARDAAGPAAAVPCPAPRGAALPLPLRLAAGRAALGLVLVPERLMQFLFRDGVGEVLTALHALQRLVRERRHTGFPFLFAPVPRKTKKPETRPEVGPRAHV